MTTPPIPVDPPVIDPTPGIMGSNGTVVVVVEVELDGAAVAFVVGNVIPRIVDACVSKPDWVRAFCAGVRI